MGWKTALTVVRDARVADLSTIGLVPDGGTTSGEEASAGLDGTFGVAVVGDDLVLIGVSEIADLEARLARELDREVVHGMFMSTVDYYIWNVHHAGGVRKWIWGEGEEIADEGDPLPEEDRVFRLDEDTLFALITARTGIEHDAWLQAEVRSLARSGGGSGAGSRRGILGRLRGRRGQR